MDLTLVLAFVAVILLLAYVSRSLIQALKATERRVVALEERVSDLERALTTQVQASPHAP